MKKGLLYISLMLLTLGATAQGSVLRSGAWWKVGVNADGLYRLTTADVPALQGVSTDSIGLYGAGGGMLSLYNSQTPTGDLQPVTIDIVDHNGNGRFDSGDELLFFGEGAGGWRYVAADGRWEFERHAYATRNYYYLTVNAPEQRRIATAPAVTASTEVTSYTAVTHVDNDLVNIFGSGQLWMGEKFSNTNPTRTFSLTLPGNADGVVRLRYALANKSSATGSFSVSTSNYSNHLSITGQEVYATTLDQINSGATAFTFSLTYTAGESSAAGYLDYIELNGHAPLAFSGGQLLVRNDQALGSAARFRATGNATGMRVWEVTSAGAEREMSVAAGVWSDSTVGARRYVLFDGSQYLSPASIGALDNQNLHGSIAADLVVVTLKHLADQANRVAALHEVFDGLSTLVATDEQVYNEFSSGKQDPMALRSLLRHLKATHPDRAPRYLLLLGKGSYDNRNLLGSGTATLVTYETQFSFDDDGQSYCSDDILGYLADEGRGAPTEPLEVGIGRLPARTVAEATHMVDKIEGYLTRRDLLTEGQHGDWRNHVALLADDADPGKPYDTAFAHSSEVVARNIGQRFPQLNVDKLYADAYHQSSGAIGSYYPDLNNALRQRINNGCLLLNYIGHGSATYIGTERYIELSDIDTYTNTDRLPLFVTSTCSYGKYDQPEDLCGAEACQLAPAAAIAVISASRPISHTERFNNDVICYALDPHNTIGDALRLAKCRTAVSQSIGLTGDPALRLSQPENRVVVTHINERPVSEGVDDTATVLSRVTVSGEVQDSNGVLLTDFEGTLYPIVYDRAVQTSTLANDNPGTEVSFTQQKNILYRGSHAVVGGRFEYSFIVPRDVAYQYDYAKLSHYAKSATDHATGCYNQLLLGGFNDSADIAASAPVIRLFIGDTNFRSGGLTDANPTLIAHLFDSAGINAGAGLGHDITAVLDGNPGSLVVLNDLYQPDVEQGGGGSVVYQFNGLTPGEHTLTLKAWNIFNLSATATIGFTVRNADTLSLSDLRCWPNPASGSTRFLLEVNNTTKVASAELQIYSPQGQRVASFSPAVSADGYVVGPVVWDLGTVPAGLYLARMIVIDTDGTTYQQTTKCIVR
ncbi:MAG: type IX secretion system sortase PorU [Bacteroidales bacterium]|nr:type IX secretion system sortase PorU [Bacteroidales bacterium]